MSDPLPPEVTRLLDAPDDGARQAAWSSFTTTYSKLLLHTARCLGGDHDAAMDRYAYMLEQLSRDDFRRLRSFAADGRSKFTTWLVVVARRLCHDHARQRYGRDTRAADRQTAMAEQTARRRLSDLVGSQIDPDAVGAADSNPERELRVAELQTALEGALARLPARDRLLLRLRFDDGLPAAEIARILAFPSPFHVYRRLNRLLAALRAELQRAGVEDPVP